jgi:hypothetical protein
MTNLPAGVARLDDSPAARRQLEALLQDATPIRYADSAPARLKRGDAPGQLVLLDLKRHIDVTRALTALRSIRGDASYDYDLVLSGAVTAQRSYLVLTAECEQPAPYAVKLVFNPTRDHELLRRAFNHGLLLGAWPRAANQRPLELQIAHPNRAGCSCPRCTMIAWALKVPSESTQHHTRAPSTAGPGARSRGDLPLVP